MKSLLICLLLTPSWEDQASAEQAKDRKDSGKKIVAGGVSTSSTARQRMIHLFVLRKVRAIDLSHHSIAALKQFIELLHQECICH